MGRLVKTHSTYIEGLIDKLNKMASDPRIKTITPGVIGKTKNKNEKLILRISRETSTGYKLIARKGKCYQEVFIVGVLNLKDLQSLINNELETIR